MMLCAFDTKMTNGSALIITLFFLLLLSLLAIGFLSRATIEVSSAYSHFMGVEATIYARAGPNLVLNRLQTAMTTNSGSLLTNIPYWLTQPGQITLISKSGVVQTVDLTSGAPSGTASSTNSLSAVDLNTASLEGFSPWQLNSDTTIGTHMYINWIYIRQNGLMDMTLPPNLVANDSNPIVGRFAFWTDDESSRINLNTAWVRGTENPSDPNYSGFPSSNGMAEPSFVNLMGIPYGTPLANSDVDAIQAYRINTNHFNSVQDAAALGNATLSQILTNQNFSLTQYNHSPNLNMFNQPRIMLTTQATNLPGGAATAGLTNFIDILTTANTDPGPIANLSTAKVSNMVNYLMAQFSRTDWPIMPGQSFLSKYGNSENQIALLAMNIIDYVRSAESTNSLVIPLRGSLTGTTFTYSAASGGGALISGGRRLYLSKMGLYPTGGTLGPKYLVPEIEVYLPLPPAGGVDTDITVNLASQVAVYDDYSKGPTTANKYYLSNIVVPTGNPANVLYGGQYATSYYPATNSDFGPGGLAVLLAIYPPGSPALATSNPKYDFAEVFFNHVNRVENVDWVIDPAVNKATNSAGTGDWIVGPGVTGGSFATNGPRGSIAMAGTLTNLPVSTIVPQQDTDGSGYLNDGWRAPAPKGSGSNPYGRVASVGELGYVCSGMDAGGGTDSVTNGAPWRSIRLQPQKQSGVLPDWALLDLFCVPVPVSNSRDVPFIKPSTQNSLGGQINPNPIVPFGTSVAREAPLMALLYGASPGTTVNFSTTSTPNVSTLAANILNHTLAASGQSYGYPNQYFLPGEISEIQGIADGGESSEALVREIVSQTTVRGNVFSVYSVGQALKEDNQGQIHVLGEARFQTMLERVEPSYLPTPTSPTRYLPVFCRRLQ